MSEINLVSPPEAHYTVYKLTDPEGKIYIGCTGKQVEQRWGKGKRYSKDTPIRVAIDALGWDAFQKEILCEKLTREGAEKLEKWFIAYYDSSDPEKGYNRFLGGLGKGAHMSEITKKNSRIAKNRMYEERPEVIEKIRNTVNARFENDSDYKGRVSRGVLKAYERDPSIKTRISNSVKGLWQDPDYRRRSAEAQAAKHENNPDLALEMQERSRQFHREHPEIGAAASAFMKEYLRSPGGRKFLESDSHGKPVRCVETGEVYRSQHAAEAATGFSNIHKACSGRNRTCGGYHWERIT